MKYRNAAEFLPAQLLQELRRHAAGQLLYVPAQQRQEWGSGTGADEFYTRRNGEIRSRYFGRQAKIPALCDEYCLSEEAVRTILYKKGENGMKDGNPIDYSGYYWQDGLVRVRRSRPDDWKFHNAGYDSQNRFFTDYEQELPTDETVWRESWENYIKSNQDNDKWICLAFETLDGEYVGGGNIHGIDERNGTFGIFLGAREDRYYLAAARLMLDFAFNERRLHRCDTGFMDGDAHSIEMFEKLGFKLEGVKRQQVFHQGRYWDERLYGLLAEEFNAAK